MDPTLSPPNLSTSPAQSFVSPFSPSFVHLPNFSPSPEPLRGDESSEFYLDENINVNPTIPTLTYAELASIKYTLGATSSLLASSVCRLYYASPSLCTSSSDGATSTPSAATSSSTWIDSGVQGAVVLIVDRNGHASKHIQMYGLHPVTSTKENSTNNMNQTNEEVENNNHINNGSITTITTLPLLLSLQLYSSLAYLSPNPLFHCFEIDCCLIGLAFGEPQGAQDFFLKVRQYIPTHHAVMNAGGGGMNIPQGSGVGGSGTKKEKEKKKRDSASSKSGSRKNSDIANNGGTSSSFLSRLFGGSSSSSTSSNTANSRGLNGDLEISGPSSVVKHELPSEWETLFKNAAIIQANKQSQMQAQAQQQQQQQ